MHPIAFEILGRPIYWYGVFVALGFLMAVATWSYLAQRDGKPDGFASEMGFWVMLSGILGARLGYVVANFGHYASHPLEIIRIDQGGLIYYGGFVGGFIGLLLFARARKLPLLHLGDYAVTGLTVGHALGRVGCFLNGCCFGKVCTAVQGVSFPPGSPASIQQAQAGLLAYADLPSLDVHPTQLYEAGYNLLLYALLVVLYLRRRQDGRIAALYLMLYPLGRFLFEFTRGDDRLQWGGWNVAQIISFVLFAVGAGMWFALSRTRPRDTTV